MSRWRTWPPGWTGYRTSLAHSDSCSSGSSIGASGTTTSGGSQSAAPSNPATRTGCPTSTSAWGSKRSTSWRHSVASAVVGDLGDLVESYDYLMPLSFPLRRLFAQCRDRTQVDLTVGVAPAVNLARVGRAQ
jgi:hypothetical protein